MLKGLLGLKLQYIFDLLGPSDDRAFENMGLVFVRGGVLGSELARGHWKHRSSFSESHHHEQVGNEVVELLHQVLGHQVSLSHLVDGVLNDGGDDVMEHGVTVLEDVSGKLEEDELVSDVFSGEGLAGDLQDNDSFGFEFIGVGTLNAEVARLGGGFDGEHVFTSTII